MYSMWMVGFTRTVKFIVIVLKRAGKMYNEPLVESSFSESNIGATIFNYTLKLKPTVILEVGALNGYSSLCFIQALKTLNSIHSKLITIDLLMTIHIIIVLWIVLPQCKSS